jgi:peroxygenase
MAASSDLTNGAPQPHNITRSISTVPITTRRKPFANPKGSKLINAGEGRANLAPSYDHPEGTTGGDWNTKHAHQTVLQQHCDFFDRDHDGKQFQSSISTIHQLITFKAFSGPKTHSLASTG